MSALFVAVYLAPFVLIVGVIACGRDKRSLLAFLFLWSGCESCNGYLAYKDMHYYDGIDQHPRVVRSDILGTWRRGDESISFADDGSFVTSHGVRGSWSTPKGALIVEDPSETDWRTMKEGGELFLFPEPRDSDPDEWNIHARFLKSGMPASKAQ